VQRDDLVAQHVVARREVGDRQVPGVAVLDEVVGGPGAGVRSGFPGLCGDFGPGEGGGGYGAEIAGYGGDVVDYGAGVGDGPCVLVNFISFATFTHSGRYLTYPFERNLAPRLNRHESAIALSRLVAHDVRAAEAVGRYESVVQVIRLPADGCGNRILVLERCVPALVRDAVGDDFVDVAVGGDEGWKRDGGKVGLHLGNEWSGRESDGRRYVFCRVVCLSWEFEGLYMNSRVVSRRPMPPPSSITIYISSIAICSTWFFRCFHA